MNDNMICPKCGPVDNDRCGECHICGFPTYDEEASRHPLMGAGKGWFCYHRNGWTSIVKSVDHTGEYPYELSLSHNWRYAEDGSFIARKGGSPVPKEFNEWGVYLSLFPARKGTLEWAWRQRMIGRYVWNRTTGLIKEYPHTKTQFMKGMPQDGWELSKFSDVEVNDIAVYENGQAARITGVYPEERLFKTGTNSYSDEMAYWSMSEGEGVSGMTKVFTIIKPHFLGYTCDYDASGRMKT